MKLEELEYQQPARKQTAAEVRENFATLPMPSYRNGRTESFEEALGRAMFVALNDHWYEGVKTVIVDDGVLFADNDDDIIGYIQTFPCTHFTPTTHEWFVVSN